MKIIAWLFAHFGPNYPERLWYALEKPPWDDFFIVLMVQFCWWGGGDRENWHRPLLPVPFRAISRGVGLDSALWLQTFSVKWKQSQSWTRLKGFICSHIISRVAQHLQRRALCRRRLVFCWGLLLLKSWFECAPESPFAARKNPPAFLIIDEVFYDGNIFSVSEIQSVGKSDSAAFRCLHPSCFLWTEFVTATQSLH